MWMSTTPTGQPSASVTSDHRPSGQVLANARTSACARSKRATTGTTLISRPAPQLGRRQFEKAHRRPGGLHSPQVQGSVEARIDVLGPLLERMEERAEVVRLRL